MKNDNFSLLLPALQATIAAKEYIVSSQSKVLSLSEKGKDIKTNIDQNSDVIIAEILSKTGVKILSEESQTNLNDDTCWIVDPVDGTYNLVRGLYAFVCTSICLLVNNNPCFSIIGRCFENEVLIAYNDSFYKISYDNLKEIDSNNIKTLFSQSTNINSSNYNISSACLMTGFPVGIANFDQNISDLTILAKNVKKIRMVGSAASSLSLVAKGNADIYFERDIFIWDVIAGLHIVKASGGDYYIEQSNNFKCLVIATRSQKLLSDVLRLINSKDIK